MISILLVPMVSALPGPSPPREQGGNLLIQGLS